jgi:peptide/nickel transport system ATP-binding protein
MYLGQVVETGPVEEIYCNARHPYTRALLASKPTLDPDRRTKVMPLTGDPPNPINPPSGCRFRTRCSFARSACADSVPMLRTAPGEIADTNSPHLVACHVLEAQLGGSHLDA